MSEEEENNAQQKPKAQKRTSAPAKPRPVKKPSKPK